MFDEDDMFSPPSFDEKINYDESMPPIYDDYCDDTYAIKKKFAYVESNKNSMLVHHEKMLYVLVILLNSFMMLLKIIMREEYMLVGIAIISSFLSMC